MKKSIILLSLGGMITIATSLAFISLPNGLTISKADNKSFTFNASVGSAQFENSNTKTNVSVITGMSDNIETSVSFLGAVDYGASIQRMKKFGENNHFVETAASVENPILGVEFGLNNIQSVDVIYGTKLNNYHVDFQFTVYDKDDSSLDSSTTVTYDSSSHLYTFHWARPDSLSKPAVMGSVVLSNTNFDVLQETDAIFIHTISVSWSC